MLGIERCTFIPVMSFPFWQVFAAWILETTQVHIYRWHLIGFRNHLWAFKSLMEFTEWSVLYSQTYCTGGYNWDLESLKTCARSYGKPVDKEGRPAICWTLKPGSLSQYPTSCLAGHQPLFLWFKVSRFLLNFWLWRHGKFHILSSSIFFPKPGRERIIVYLRCTSS